MISLKNITKSFGRIRAVDNISFDIGCGEVVGFVGPNGAGKSTTMRIITTYLAPSSGSVTIDGLCAQKEPHQARAKIGYLPESAALYNNMHTLDFLCFVGSLRRLDNKTLTRRLSQVSDVCGITSVLDQKIGILSKGFRQRVGLAQAILHDPPILILDEPTIGLDPNQLVQIRSLLKEVGQTKTVLISSHILSEISQTCDRLLVMHKGALVAQGSLKDLQQKIGTQNQYELSLRGDRAEIESQLRSCPFCLDVLVTTSQDNKHDLLITCAGSEDHSEALFGLAVTHHWSLGWLAKKQTSLESVFKELTQ